MRRLGLLLVLLAILIDVAQSSNVNAAFKLNNVIYKAELANPDSAEYEALADTVTDEVTNLNDFTVVFFGPGSELNDDGEADSVIVYARVETNIQNQKKANKFVKRKLKNSGVTGLVRKSVSVGVRVCVSGNQAKSACTNMKNKYKWFNNFIICVEARDRYECIQWLNDEKVDVVHGDAKDIYLANEMYGAQLSVVANTRDEDKEDDIYQNRIVAVARRSTITNGINSLRGSKFCSTGYGETSGWFVPLSKLLEKDELECSGNGPVLEQNLDALSSYFGEACLPGQWGPIEDVSNVLKTEYSNLCSLCNNPAKCMAPSGPGGALECLNSGGDVAWINFEAVEGFSFDNPGDFGFLCPDGSVVDLNSVNPCMWAGKPWPGWLIRANEDEEGVIVSALSKAAKKAKNPFTDWAEVVLGIDKSSVIIELDPPVSPESYLKQGEYYITINEPGCEGVPVKFCVKSKPELQKCIELAQVLKSRRVRPLITCYEATDSDCPSAIVDKTADFVPLDGGDVFTNYRDHDLIPVIAEVYGKHAASYYAVAVVKKDSGISTLAGLEGKKSCHTGIDKTAGWNMPLITLLRAGLLASTGSYPQKIGGFFSDSCAPGANSSTYNPNGTNPSSLCDLCIGNEAGNDVCVRNDNERFYGYSGAFRCLVTDGGGDVAFIKHTTVPDNTGEDCGNDWCEGLNSDDYRLLCKDGGTKKVENYLDCNLAKVPSHMVVIRGDNTADDKREDIRNLLIVASDKFPQGNQVFALFGDHGAYHDVLFKNSATSLTDFSAANFEALKTGPYWQALEDL